MEAVLLLLLLLLVVVVDTPALAPRWARPRTCRRMPGLSMTFSGGASGCNEGLHINTLKANNHLSPDAVGKAIEELLFAGVVYTTVDGGVLDRGTNSFSRDL